MKFLSFDQWKEEQREFYMNRARPYKIPCPLVDEDGWHDDESVNEYGYCDNEYGYCDFCGGDDYIYIQRFENPQGDLLEAMLTKKNYLKTLTSDTCDYDRALNNPVGKTLFDMGYVIYQAISKPNLHRVRISNNEQ